MFKELVMPTEISIKDKKKIINGTIRRAALYASSKVIEVLTPENESFYLIFYKNSLIYGDMLGHVEKGTFIDKAFVEGIVIDSPHPLLTSFIPELSLSVPNKNKLFSQLQTHFSLQEVVHIATTLDSFFEKEQLIQMIDKVYFHYRRSGKFMKSFQIIQMLSDFAPALKSVKERMDSHEYFSYHDFYHSASLPSILKKDPLFVELHCFKNRLNPEKLLLLTEILSQQECYVEQLLLWLEKVRRLQTTDSIEKYTELALRFVSMEEWVLILGEANINPFRALPNTKFIMEKMIQTGNYEKAALYIFEFIEDLPKSFGEIQKAIWENSDAKFVYSHLEDFITLLQHLPRNEKTEQIEKNVFQLAANLLQEYDLKTVHEKLLPIQDIFPDLVVIRKINEMTELVEDPDQMMKLGDYYAEFKQFDSAIDCFCWEMELQPQNPEPVRKISKMYQLKGMVKEASDYQKVYAQLKSNQEAG